MSKLASASDAVARPDAVKTVTLLPKMNTYVDPAQPTTSFANQPLVVSSNHNATEKLAYVMFDLTPIPLDATITACQLVFTVTGQQTKQIIKLLLVTKDDWTDSITYQTAPAASTTAVGTWLVQHTPQVARVVTNPDNPVLADVARCKHQGGASQKLSLQISSVYGPEGGPVTNSYYSYQTAAGANLPGASPRLIVRYQPHPEPLARDWHQFQADPRHSGRSPWNFANTPTHTYHPDTVVSGIQITSPVIIVDDLLYFFTPTTLKVMNPAATTAETLRSGLPAYNTAALGPNRLLYAASKTELAAFDLSAAGNQAISVPLTNSSPITVGADGSVYLAQGSTLWAYVQRLGTLVPAWSKDLGTTLISRVTANVDGTVVYVASANKLYALDSGDGSDVWPPYQLPAAASHLTAPVCGAGNGLSYFGVDDTLYAFGRIGKPQNEFNTAKNMPVSQPVIDANDILHVVQSDKLFTVSADGTTSPAQTSIPGLAATRPVDVMMDGTGNLFIIDNDNKLFVCTPGLKLANQPQTLPFSQREPGLQLAPNGSLFSNSSSALFRIKPDVETTVTVTSYEDATSYRAQSSLMLDGAPLPAASSVVFQSGRTIAIKPGFSVPLGTQAAFTTGS